MSNWLIYPPLILIGIVMASAFLALFIVMGVMIRDAWQTKNYIQLWGWICSLLGFIGIIWFAVLACLN